jgi:hypothetical protein
MQVFRLKTSPSLLVALMLFAAGPVFGSATARSNFEALDEELASLRPDPERSARVENLRILRGPAVFNLERGRLVFCTPVSGRTCAAIFLGKGQFSFSPKGRMEREHLARSLGAESLSVALSTVAFLFADSTELELMRSVSIEPMASDPQAGTATKELIRFLRDPKSKWIDPHLALGLRSPRHSRMFYAHIGLSSQVDPLLFSIDPYSTEEIQLRRRCEGDVRTITGLPDIEVISQCSWGEQPAAPIRGDENSPFSIAEELLDVRIENDLRFRASARLRIPSPPEAPDLLPLHLFRELRVDSVWINGVVARFCQPDESSVVWIDWDRPVDEGAVQTVRLTYGGNLIDRVAGGWFNVKSPSGWYPTARSRDKSFFDITYSVPDWLSLASVGARIENRIEGRTQISRYVTIRPVRNASFQIGLFQRYCVSTAGLPSICVLMESAGGHQEVGRVLGEQGVLSYSNMEKNVAADLASSVRFFSSTYGPSPDTLFTATDIAGTKGIAFPGLLNLSWSTYQTDGGGPDAVFRAHEAAHQWWGIGVDYNTYRDRWLSEAFAEFSGLWFMQISSGDNREFLRRMDKSRTAIMGVRKFLVGHGQSADPIGLGDRVETSTTRGDFDLILYDKGAWVLQMLRNMLLDLDTMREERFIGLMREFYKTYLGKSASTDEFQAIAEKHVGEDLDWFFQEWVYGTAIPHYRFAWKAEPVADGSYRIRCRIEQQEAPKDFRMYVPIQVQFDGDSYAFVRVKVEGPMTELDLPLAPSKPHNLILNPLASVLCDVEETDW